MQLTVSLTFDLPASGDINGIEILVLDAGRQAMLRAVSDACRQYERQVMECPHCQSLSLQSEGTDKRVVLCSFGRVELCLRRLRCEGCGRRFRPADVFLSSLEGSNVSGKLKEACVLAGASWPYETAAVVLRELCGAKVSGETVRKMTRQVGAAEMEEQLGTVEELLNPIGNEVRAEREKELSRQVDTQGSAPDMLMVGLDGGWVPSREQVGGMEGKVGVVASEVESIGSGRRRLSRRRYVATFEDSKRLGMLAYGAAEELGGEEAREQIVLGDGARWIKNEAELHFPRAVKILDWPHVSRAVRKGVWAALPGKRRQAERREVYRRTSERLWHGDVEEALTELVALRPKADEEPVMALEEAIAYIRGQRGWLGNYSEWREEGYPVGSGLVERAVELVINRRLKGRGMRWCRANADAVVALRVKTLNNEWDAIPSPLVA